MSRKKKTFEEVRAAFNLRGYILLSTNYSNNSSPLNYICSNGHNATINFNTLQMGIGCSECSGNKKKTIKEVREIFKSRGFTLLSTEYKNALLPMEYLCSNSHQTKISFNSLMNGNGCLDCSGKKKKTLEEAREFFNSRGYTLLSNEYKSNNSPLEYLCSNGHQAKICFASLQRGSGCPSCANRGFNPNIPAILYYLRFQFEGNFYYKIGITNNTTSKRFQSEKTSYTVIKKTTYTLGKDAYNQEQTILKKFSAYRYKGKPFLTTNGNTELFSLDVLQLDDTILTT